MAVKIVIEIRFPTLKKIGKTTFAASVLIFLMMGTTFALLQSTILIEVNGKIGYSPDAYLETFNSARGIGGIITDIYSRDQISYSRMQLFAEIDNSAANPEDVLVPNGLGYGEKDDAWSEGGINYEYLKRNLAYLLDKGMLPLMGLWITNIDPLENRNYPIPDIAPKLPMANEAGYTLFLESLNTWLIENYPSNGYVVWEPAWEFNLWPWTNWGGAGGNRYWRLVPSDYENAMTNIRSVLDNLPDRRIFLASHIVVWSSEEWIARGKPRINGTDSIGYLNGMKLCDFWGISLYGEWSLTSGNDVETLGVHGYVDWLFEKIIKQCAEDPDIGDKFIGTFEYNMPLQFFELRDDLLTDYTKEQLDTMAIDYINYSYSKVPEYFEHMKMFGWWIPFGSDSQWNAWKSGAEQYSVWVPQ